jgi:Kef-type K+ transport system membrane component KefB
MNSATLTSLVIIFAVIAAAPIIADALSRWVALPSVVIEIVAGIVVGPALHWVHVDTIIELLSNFGLAALMFLAGLEIDLPRVAGSPLRRAVAGWGISVALGLAVGASLAPLDGTRSGLIVGLAITTTALGTLLPILRDSGELATDFGTHVLAGASVGELGPIVAVSLLLSTDRPARTIAVLIGFVLLIVAAGWIALRRRGHRLTRLLEETLTTSGQLAVRLVVLFLSFMVWVAFELGLDTLLGAFAAGMVFRLFSAGASEREAELVEAKLQGLAFGFLVPVFFVVSGVQFDLQAITDDPSLLLFAVGFLALFLVVRGGPSALLQRSMETSDRTAYAAYLATELPLVVVITSIGVETGRLNAGKAAALVTAALLSVLIFPIVAGRLRHRALAMARA